MTDTHFGGCACGTVRYRVQGNPVVGTVCHCRFCQRRLASAFAVLASFKEDAIEILQGEQSEVEHRSDESGRWLRMTFCPMCGTTISHTAELRPGMRTIAGGYVRRSNLVQYRQAHLGSVKAAVGLHSRERRHVRTGLRGAAPMKAHAIMCRLGPNLSVNQSTTAGHQARASGIRRID